MTKRARKPETNGDGYRVKFDMRLGDCLDVLPTLEAGSVHCCVTSPPYWGLRDYQVDGQLGLEETPEEYVAKMVEVFRAVRRVLRDDGTLWLNLGDSYCGSPTGKQSNNAYATGEAGDGAYRRLVTKMQTADGVGPMNAIKDYGRGVKPKDLVGMPWAVAFALRADGWYLRSDIIWHKPNPMPESCTDRPTKSHEYVFLLTKSAKYFYDADAVREPSTQNIHGRGSKLDTPSENAGVGHNGWQRSMTRDKEIMEIGRNKRSVWTIPEEEWAQFLEWKAQQVQQKPDVWQIATQPYAKAHFATFPEALVLPCILAGTSEEGCCAECGAPWERVVERTKSFESGSGRSGNAISGKQNLAAAETNSTPDIRMGPCVTTQTTGWQPTCNCCENSPKPPNGDGMPLGPYPTVPCTVLDPFLGSGTTAKVAQQYGRSFVGCELSAEYLELAIDRFKQSRLFA